MRQSVDPRLAELQRQWQELEDTLTAKGQRLFDSNKGVLYEQSCADIDSWVTEVEKQIIKEDIGYNLTTVTLLVQKQTVSLSADVDSNIVKPFCSHG